MAEQPSNPNESLLTFPCDFTIKVFGHPTPEFESAVLMIVHRHVPSFSDQMIQLRQSTNGKYCAMSITVQATSKAQLDDIYQDLSSSPQVLMAL